MRKLSLIKNHTATRAFIILLVGFLIILVAGLFVFSIYLNRSRHQVSRARFSFEFVKAVKLAKALPPNQLSKNIHALGARGLRVSVAKKPPRRAQTLYTNNTRKLRQFARKHYRKLLAAIPLRDGRWLIVRGRVARHALFYTGFIISMFLLFVALILLCFWAVKYLALPVREFTRAAKRFGVDVQSPPMAVAGPAEVRTVITAFNEMQERIRRLLHDRTQMLAAISHDLRTPITRLQLRVEYLKDTTQYEKAVADLKEMEQMIASILSFARDYARTETMERFDMNALLESLCNDMVDTGHQVEYHSSDLRVPILGRLSALKRAFTNLIGNAIKFGEKADVSLTQKDDVVQIVICDQGPGIPKDEMENVFEPFYRVDTARSPQTSGSGLGLAVARDIIRAHGGDITLQNRKPHGLKVVVTLPCK